MSSSASSSNDPCRLAAKSGPSTLRASKDAGDEKQEKRSSEPVYAAPDELNVTTNKAHVASGTFTTQTGTSVYVMPNEPERFVHRVKSKNNNEIARGILCILAYVLSKIAHCRGIHCILVNSVNIAGHRARRYSTGLGAAH